MRRGLYFHLMIIAVCEDEKKVRSYIVSSFKSEGHSVYDLSSLSELVETLKTNRDLDILILDRLLGNQDSAAHLNEIKNLSPQTKILVLSAIDTPEQKAKVLDLGAHDYLSKPFRLIELQARVRALARQSQINQTLFKTLGTRADHIRELKNLKIDKLMHKVFVNSKPLDLSNKEYQLLLTFCEYPGRVYNRYQLLDMVWFSQFETESNVVEVTVKNLRKKLSTLDSEVKIESRRQVGYWVEE